MTESLRNPSNLTPDLLTRTFEHCGLRGAEVTDLRLRARVDGLFSIRAFYEVSYAPSAPDTAPRKIFLKLALLDSEPSQSMIRQEVDFYQQYGAITALPLVRNFGGAYSDETGAAHLLLEDFSLSHMNPPP